MTQPWIDPGRRAIVAALAAEGVAVAELHLEPAERAALLLEALERPGLLDDDG